MDADTKRAIKQLAVAIDGLAGMAAGCAAYIAMLDGAAQVDRRKAAGLSQKLVPEGVSGDDSVAPAKVAHLMIEQIGTLARELHALKMRTLRNNTVNYVRDWEIKPSEINAAAFSRTKE